MENISSFDDFKLSVNLMDAIKKMGFKKPTKIQLKNIPLCLKNKDVVVQAKTGSGKTLAFLIPLIENLLSVKCNSSFGIQAIILVPTAELASQTISVLSDLLKYCPNITFISAVGGKAYTGKKEEWLKIDTANVLISTIGRLLEHQEKNINFDLSNLKYLIIDETDYLLEKNFFEEMHSVLNYLPKNRITWLFSATQISEEQQLKRLLLKSPVFIGTECDKIMMPQNLTQTFMKIDLSDKIQMLWNILYVQHNSNIIVFFSNQKQVLFMYRLFCSLKPPYQILQLRSNMRLDKRINSIQSFSKHNKSCVLFATDIASRGLDFPKVSLIVQYDLPKEFDDYVHRAGRTARFNTSGVSLLMVMPSEMKFITLLKEKNINLKQTYGSVLKNKLFISEKASMIYSSDIELFKIAKNAFISYLRDYSKIPPRFHSSLNSENLFLIKNLPIRKFAESMGFKSIPTEISELELNEPLYSYNQLCDKPFFVVKKKLNSQSKRLLDIISEDEYSSEDINCESTKLEEEVKPAFTFDEVLHQLQSSSNADKEYFHSFIKSNYGSKKRKLTKIE